MTTARLKRHRMGWRVSLASLLAAAAAVATMAQAREGPTSAPVTQGNIAVVSGGVGLEESNAIKRMASSYPLRLVMSRRDGAYHVAQDFKLLKDGKVVLHLPDAGPWLLIDVPPGRYAVEGVFDGELQRRSFALPSAGTTVHWVLPAPLD